MAPHRLRNLVVREVSLVDHPAIKENFYIVKRLAQEENTMGEENKTLTVEEVIKRHTEYQTGVNARIQETKAFLEGALEREVDTETRGTLTKALESLESLAKMKHPGPMMMEPDEEMDKKKAKKSEESEPAKKSLEGAITELKVSEIDYTKQNEALAQAVTKGLDAPLTLLTKAIEGIGKMVEEVSKEQASLKKELDNKPGRDEIPNRKGVAKNGTQLPKEEDLLKEGEEKTFVDIQKSEDYKKALPLEKLRMFAVHFTQ